MRYILLVEDQDAKAADIRNVVQGAATCPVQIDRAVSVNEARSLLQQRKYDLVVLDLALPVVENAAADPNGGLVLLEEIDKTDTLIRPGFVVGLTAFDNLKAQFQEQFASRLWSIELYDAGIGSWRSRLSAKIRYLTTTPRREYRSDVCIITALDMELDAVMSWNANWQSPEALDETTFTYRGSLSAGNGSVDVHAAACLRKGMVAAGLLTSKMIAEFSPRLVVMTGICAGNQEKTGIGDIIVGDPCWNWQDGRIEPADTRFSPHQLDLAPELHARIKVLKRDGDVLRAAYDSFTGDKPDELPKIKVGPLATGSAVIADEAVMPSIARQHRDLIGAEMEAYGVYAAAIDARTPKPLCIAMKSVCDFGTEEKDDKYQKYAAHVSSYVAKVFIERFISEIRSLG